MEVVEQFWDSLRPLTSANFNHSLISTCLHLHDWGRQTLGNFQKILPDSLRIYIGSRAKNNPTGSESSSTSSTSHFYTNLWGVYTAPKVKVFLWRLYNNIFPTRKNLSKRITTISPCCAMCPADEEDVLHIFFHCRIATETCDGASVGGLIRDHLGRHAETIAIRESLRLTRRFGYTNYTVESDCKAIIDQLQARSGILGSLGHIHQ
ncbi:hypothetical protein M9H77_35125 [Catharanthus roseus]|uniref:Uncharacterized protein n=1 Tax=Catharanthus roseus TaxID=4058 RepID=A0ACB9ZRS6_CATRO|nr:hypothetical protein M9H77_35125 [Catharanthus roseus]